MGRTGRFATSSPYKFYPCADGGWLWRNDGGELPQPPRGRPPLRDELRALRDLAQSFTCPPRAPRVAELESDWAAAGSLAGVPGRDWIDDSGRLSRDYLVDEQDRLPLRVSGWLLRHTATAPMLERRRQRWRQWAAAVQAMPHCRALLPSLPEHSTPYMFPLLVDDPPALFYPLKRLGLPIQRWDDMAISDCPVSRRYRQGLFHLPCHQALTDDDMHWLVHAVERAISGWRR